MLPQKYYKHTAGSTKRNRPCGGVCLPNALEGNDPEEKTFSVPPIGVIFSPEARNPRTGKGPNPGDALGSKRHGADPDTLASFYAEDAVNDQVGEAPVSGRAAIRRMFADGFASAEMVCIAENIFEDGEWAILEWRDRWDCAAAASSILFPIRSCSSVDTGTALVCRRAWIAASETVTVHPPPLSR